MRQEHAGTFGGGFGYACLQRHFLPRHGATEAQINRMMVANPSSVFSAG